MKNFRERLQQCVANYSRLMSDLIFKIHLKSVVNILFRNILNFFLDGFFHIFLIPLRKVGDLYAPPCTIYIVYVIDDEISSTISCILDSS